MMMTMMVVVMMMMMVVVMMMVMMMMHRAHYSIELTERTTLSTMAPSEQCFGRPSNKGL